MVWNPTERATDIRAISPNLLAYFRTNQTQALNWANSGTGLADFAVIYNTNEGLLYTIFPNLMVFRERHRSRFTDGGQDIEYSFDFIYEVAGADATALRVNAKKYGYALESMILNIPSATLMNGVSNYTRPTVNEVVLEHGPLRGEEGNWMIGSTLSATFEFQEFK